MDTGNFDTLEEDISDAVDAAVSEISDKVNAGVSGISDKVNAGVSGISDAVNVGVSGIPGSADDAIPGASGAVKGVTWESNDAADKIPYTNRTARIPHYAPSAPMKNVGSVTGTVSEVVGITGCAFYGAISAFLILDLVISGLSAFHPGFIVMILLAIGFFFLFRYGKSLRQRLKRAKEYARLCGNQHYCNIKEMARQLDKQESFVRSDVKKILKAGIFPEGHLDREETCLMLDNQIWQQYLTIEKQRMIRDEDERTAQEQLSKMKAQSGDGKAQAGQTPEQQNPELQAMIREGEECIKKLREMNDNIEGEVISAKLFTLENLLKEIFERVQQHPEQMPKMHKFMDYYLPTTMKLVRAYEDFDNMSAPGEEVLEAKEEIEKTLDTINHAFTELLNRLFRDSAFDATTDAQVLKTMLEKEGLTGSPIFEKVH